MCLPDLALEFAERIQDVGRSRRVQRRGRFIGQDELWLAGESWREDRASVAVASRLSVTVVRTPQRIRLTIRRGVSVALLLPVSLHADGHDVRVVILLVIHR